MNPETTFQIALLYEKSSMFNRSQKAYNFPNPNFLGSRLFRTFDIQLYHFYKKFGLYIIMYP